MAGIKDIAERAGASIATVSRVINGSGYVAAATRARVEAAIAESGYRPNAGARLMRTAESRMIGLLLPALDLHFFGILAHEVEQALSARGYRALICSTDEDPAREEEYVAALLAQRVDGMLAVSVTEPVCALAWMVRAGSRFCSRKGPVVSASAAMVQLFRANRLSFWIGFSPSTR